MQIQIILFQRKGLLTKVKRYLSIEICKENRDTTVNIKKNEHITKKIKIIKLTCWSTLGIWHPIWREQKKKNKLD